MSNDNTFDIPVEQNSQQISLPAELIPFGYSYKIDVDVFGKTIAFERDEVVAITKYKPLRIIILS
jgi:hypothetical protein